jgi:hypothetical protein
MKVQHYLKELRIIIEPNIMPNGKFVENFETSVASQTQSLVAAGKQPYFPTFAAIKN